MNNFVSDEHKLFSGRSFLDKFLLNTKDLIDCIEPVVMNFDNGLPDQLKNIRNIDFLVIDFTQEPQELNFIWSSLKHLLIPNRTVVLFNGLSKTSIPFLTKISDQMKPIAKPMTIAKAFIFQEQVLSDEQVFHCIVNFKAFIIQHKINFQLSIVSHYLRSDRRHLRSN